MLLEKTERNGNFLSVKHGAICLESADGELVEGEVDGEKYAKYYKKFAAVEGRITKIEWYAREHDGSSFRGLHIKMKDGGEHYILDLPFGKRQFDYFTKIAENIDYEKPVRFEAWADTKNAKRGHVPTAFIAKQDGNIIQWKYTRDNMGDCPPAEHSEITDKWSFDKQREWLLKRILDVVAPVVDKLNEFDEPQPEYTGDEPEAPATLDQMDSKLKNYVTGKAKTKAMGTGPDDEAEFAAARKYTDDEPPF